MWYFNFYLNILQGIIDILKSKFTISNKVGMSRLKTELSTRAVKYEEKLLNFVDLMLLQN